MTTATKPPRGGTPIAARLAGIPPVVKITVGVAIAILLVMGACATQAAQTEPAGPRPADVLPEGFPVPAGSQVLQGEAGSSRVVILGVSDGVADVVAFYREQLAAAGWQVDPWEGTNPVGEAAQGLILTQGERTGALSVTAGPDGGSMVEINMNQPVSPTEGSVMDHQG